MSNVSTNIKNFFSRYFTPDWKSLVSPTLVATLILIITLVFFGTQNSMIAPFVTVSYVMFIHTKKHFSLMIRHWFMYMVIAVASYVAVMNLPLCIIVNAGMFFFLAYLFTDEYHPTNYEPCGMALIFFQTASLHTPAQLAGRLGAISVSFAIILAFVLLTNLRYYEKNPIADDIRQGFTLAQETMEACKKGDDTEIRRLHLQIRDVNQRCSEEIYSYNRISFRRRGKVNFYCRFVAFFQVFNYLTRHYREPENLEKAQTLLSYYKDLLNRQVPQDRYWMLMLRTDKFSIKDFKCRFALREVLVLTPALALAWSVNAQYAYWMVFSLFYMLTPTTDFTWNMVKKRVAGTILGIVISMVLFLIFPGLPGRVTITAVLNLFIYSAAGDVATIAYITCATLAMQTLDLATVSGLLRCLIATFIGAGVALLASRFLFVVHTDKQISRLSDRLSDIRQMLLESSENGELPYEKKNPHTHYVFSGRYLDEEGARHHFNDQLLIRSYLISRRIQDLDEMRPPQQRDPGLLEREKKHMQFMAIYLLYGNRKELPRE